MRRIRIGILALLALAVVVEGTVVVRTALAQRPRVGKYEGHLSPLEVRITFPDGEKRTELLVGMGYAGAMAQLSPPQHNFTFCGTGNGQADVSIYLDTISTIKDTTESEALVILKDGTERRLSLKIDSSALCLANKDGGRESIMLSRIKRVEFLKPARKDRDGHAMFDEWQYSPYTGEKLPED